MDKSPLYTRTGDNGTTSLADGSRESKDSPRLDAYGTVDELSSHLGLLLTYPILPSALCDTLMQVQNLLFSIGGALATPGDSELYGLTHGHIRQIEQAIDATDSLLPPMRSFILPGGTPAAAQAHIARTVCRRAERRIITLSAQAPVSPLIVTYLNRLSDLLFAIARLCNHLSGVADIPWSKPSTPQTPDAEK